jgi:predicted type IV restriction endonuclease
VPMYRHVRELKTIWGQRMAAYQDKAKDRIKRGLRKFTPIAREARRNGVNEADTRLIITAILSELLGWDTFEDITSEQCIKGQYCDYAIKREGGLLAIIEAKSIATTLSQKHLYQAVSYAAAKGVDWVILTNGADWQVYRMVFSQPVGQDLVFDVSLLDETLKPAEKAELLYLISREAHRAGDLSAYQKKKSALCGANIARALLSEKMLERLRLEMRAQHGHSASHQELATILVEEVFRPDVQDDETPRLVRRAAVNGRATQRKKSADGDDATASRRHEARVGSASEYGAMVLEALRVAAQPLGRADLVTLTGMPDDVWSLTIRHLLDQGAVIQEGERRGAKYLFQNSTATSLAQTDAGSSSQSMSTQTASSSTA